jgi:uncharacterized protein YbaP (TraB family)
MWSVQGPKSKAYLLGSMHMFKAASYPLDPRIEKAYQSCPKVVFEADVEGPGTDDIREMMLKMGTYHDGKTLRKEVSGKTYAMFKARAEANNLDVEHFDTYRPWLAALSIASVELKRLGFTAEDGLDAHFSKEAAADKKKMIYLETARQQLDLLANAFPGKEEDLLRQALEEIAVLEKASTEMVQVWKAGDAAQMETFTQKSLKEFPEVEKKLFTERNKAWTKRISSLLSQEGDVFIVVGAGHLVGKGGLLEMLNAKGYKVVQQ